MCTVKEENCAVILFVELCGQGYIAQFKTGVENYSVHAHNFVLPFVRCVCLISAGVLFQVRTSNMST